MEGGEERSRAVPSNWNTILTLKPKIGEYSSFGREPAPSASLRASVHFALSPLVRKTSRSKERNWGARESHGTNKWLSYNIAR